MKMDMLRFVGATNVDCPLVGAEASGPFVLKSAEGLGPPEVIVKLAQTVLEQAVYQGKRPALRQIVALISLQPDWDNGGTAEELRSRLYSMLTPRYGQMVRVEVFHQGVMQGYAQGQISKMEVALFTKDPAVQVTMDCDYAYLLGPNTIVQQPQRVSLVGETAIDIENDGSAPAGFLMGAILDGFANPLILTDDDPRGQKIQIDGIAWAPGDRLVVDTRPGSRGLWRGPGGGALQSVLNNMNAPVSEWLQLYEGNNRLRLNVSAFTWDGVYDFQHQPAYWGV